MRKLFLAIAILTVGLVAGGVAWATIPNSTTGVISGCYKNTNPAKGAVIVVDVEAGESCPSGYTPLNWNKQHVHHAGRTSYFGESGPAVPNGGGQIILQCPPGKIYLAHSTLNGDPDNLSVYSERFLWYPTEGRQWYWRAGPDGSSHPVGVQAELVCINNPDS